MSAGRRLAKEIHRTQKSIRHFSDGQATVSKWDPDDIRIFRVLITPKSGLYKRGRFEFEVEIPDDYPHVCPTVNCLTPIYHPNIDTSEEENNVCLNILSDDWEPTNTLEDCIQGLLFLMHNPNLDDPLAPLIPSDMSAEEFERNVQRSLLGESFDDMDFPRNLYDEDGNPIPETEDKLAPVCDEIVLSKEIVCTEEINNAINANLTAQLSAEVENVVQPLDTENVVEMCNESMSNITNHNEADDSNDSNLSICDANADQSNEHLEACAVQDSPTGLPPLITRQLSKQERLLSAHIAMDNVIPFVQDCENININECSTRTVYQYVDGLMPITNLIGRVVNDLLLACFKS